MKISVKQIMKTFHLEYDIEGNTSVSIRQATTADKIVIADLFAEQTQIWEDADVGKIQMKRKWNPEALKQARAFATLVGADLEDDDGNPIFRFGNTKNGPELSMQKVEFNRAWGSLPIELTEEIYKLILKVNTDWDPEAVGE